MTDSSTDRVLASTLTDRLGPAVPLPDLALCPTCDSEIRVRNDRTLYKHDRPYDPHAPIIIGDDGYAITQCPQSRQPAGKPLEPTFARWLWMQSKRRDDHTNVLTRFAVFQFRGCTRSPRLTARDVEWSTAEELHGRLHLVHLARTGSDLRSPYNGKRCDWMCAYLHQAAEVYAQLLASRTETNFT